MHCIEKRTYVVINWHTAAHSSYTVVYVDNFSHIQLSVQLNYSHQNHRAIFV